MGRGYTFGRGCVVGGWGLGRSPGVGVGVSEGVWGSRMSCIKLGLPSGGGFCNEGVKRGSVRLPLDLTCESHATATQSL